MVGYPDPNSEDKPMTERRPSWPGRIWLAISAFWQILFNGEFARNIWRLHQGAEAPPPEPPAPKPAALLQEAGPAAALQLLGLLQQDGTLEPGFDAAALRLTGNVVGEPPFTGTLTHKGWVAMETKLPKLAAGHNVKILAPAELEL
jgi:hypothetical protein